MSPCRTASFTPCLPGSTQEVPVCTQNSALEQQLLPVELSPVEKKRREACPLFPAKCLAQIIRGLCVIFS